MIKPIDILNFLTPQSGYSKTADIRYGDDARQQLDLYRPKNAIEGPLLIFIYGGAWREGAKEDYEFVGEAFSSEGYTIAIPDYRLFPQVGYPHIIDDVQQAIEFIRSNTDKLDIDARRMVIIGHSSGAHSAAMLVSSDRYYRESSFINALVGISGPYDLPLELAEVNEVFRNVDQPSSVKPPELVVSGHPPTLLLHGSDDKRVKPEHTERYQPKLLDANVNTEVIFMEDVGHVDIIAGVASRLEFLNATKNHIIEFLEVL